MIGKEAVLGVRAVPLDVVGLHCRDGVAKGAGQNVVKDNDQFDGPGVTHC